MVTTMVTTVYYIATYARLSTVNIYNKQFIIQYARYEYKSNDNDVNNNVNTIK
jgi:hypothetical protein